MPDSKGRERFLSDAERKALLAAVDASPHPAVSPLVRLALATGARKGELLALDWASVDLDRRTARLLDTKNGESRTMPLVGAAVDTLKAWRKGRLPVGDVFPRTKDELRTGALRVTRQTCPTCAFTICGIAPPAISP